MNLVAASLFGFRVPTTGQVPTNQQNPINYSEGSPLYGQNLRLKLALGWGQHQNLSNFSICRMKANPEAPAANPVPKANQGKLFTSSRVEQTMKVQV